MGQIGRSWDMEHKSNKWILINGKSRCKIEKTVINWKLYLETGFQIYKCVFHFKWNLSFPRIQLLIFDLFDFSCDLTKNVS